MTGLLLRVSIGDVDHLDALRGEGAAFAGVLDRADAGLPVPACGEWRLRELAHHLGGVHRWAAAAALGDGTAPSVAVPPMPPDDALADWLREGLDALMVALADQGRPCWTLAGPATAAWWRRRQALETAVHRVDAERVLGPRRARSTWRWPPTALQRSWTSCTRVSYGLAAQPYPPPFA